MVGGLSTRHTRRQQQQQQRRPVETTATTAIRADNETGVQAANHYDDYDDHDNVLDRLDYEMTRDADSYVDITAADSFLNHHEQQQQQNSSSGAGGSTVMAAIFNFTNCIIGAGAIGLGGAIAASGGLISVVTIVGVAVLVKQSLDLTLQLSLVSSGSSSSAATTTYEDLGKAAYGHVGKFLVMASKFVYSFGCLVAYTVVIQDNLGPAVSNLLYGTSDQTSSSSSYLYWLLQHNAWCTWIVSTTVMLPLCLLRDMTPLASASVVSILCMSSIVAIVIYFWWMDVAADLQPFPDQHINGTITTVVSSNSRGNDFFLDNWRTETLATTATADDAVNNEDLHSTDWYHHWTQIHWLAYLQNLGTFVFCFVCQHTVHLAYASLKPELRTLRTWKRVSTASLSLACTVSLTVGIFCYMTFWEHTQSDIFQIYPNSSLLDGAKLLLCIAMLLTFPLPFFACRELIIVFFFPFAPSAATSNHGRRQMDVAGAVEENRSLMTDDLEEPLLSGMSNEDNDDNSIVQVGSEHADNNNNNDNGDGDFESPPRWNRHESMASVLSNSMDLSVLSARAVEVMNSALLPGQERQLKLSYHVCVTAKLWFVATGLAIASPNLGDVLDLVGCASGTLIAFVLPGLFALKLQGYSHLAALLLVVGGVVGTVGTTCSLRQFVRDAGAVGGGGGGLLG